MNKCILLRTLYASEFPLDYRELTGTRNINIPHKLECKMTHPRLLLTTTSPPYPLEYRRTSARPTFRNTCRCTICDLAFSHFHEMNKLNIANLGGTLSQAIQINMNIFVFPKGLAFPVYKSVCFSAFLYITGR